MSRPKVWGTSQDGKIEYVSLTKERLEEALQLSKTAFFPHENVCKVYGLANKPELFDEFDAGFMKIAKEGVSLLAVDKENGKVVGIRFNKIQTKNTATRTATDIQSKYEEVRGLRECLGKLENLVDPFTHYNVDCVFKFVCLAVSPGYGGRGIGSKLSELAIELATELYKGNNVKTSLDDTSLPLEPRPKVVTSVFTTFKTQRIGRKLNFESLKEVSYEDLHHNGQTFASVLNDETKSITIECKKLQ